MVDGRNMVWYRHSLDTGWQAILRTYAPLRYTRPHEWLANAETMMAGRGRENVLWRKNDEDARRFIWC